MRSRTDRFTGSWPAAAATLFLLGATLGTALDAIHTVTRTTEYARPIWSAAWAFAWWTPPLFAGAGLAVGLARPLAERALGSRDPAPARGLVVAAMLVFAVAYALSGTLPGGNPARAAALAVCFGAAFAICDRTALGVLLAVGAGLGGALAEIALIRVGGFRHLQPDVLGLPCWLPLLYACGSVAVGALGRRLVAGARS